MGLLAQAGIIQKVPLCEIEAYNRMDSTFGIFVTIRVVGRAQLLQFVQVRSTRQRKGDTQVLFAIQKHLTMIQNFL